MSDIINRALRSSSLANDHSLPLSARVEQSFEALSGLMLADIDEGRRPAIESLLVASNEIMGKYAIDSESDYKN